MIEIKNLSLDDVGYVLIVVLLIATIGYVLGMNDQRIPNQYDTLARFCGATITQVNCVSCTKQFNKNAVAPYTDQEITNDLCLNATEL